MFKKHGRNCSRNVRRCGFIYDDFVFHGIDEDVQVHDISKLCENEFVQYRLKFFPTDSEKTDEATIESLFGSAWEYHQQLNSHHWQNWTKTATDIGNPYLWEICCVHMVIDWMAMGYKFNDSAQKYYEKNKDKIEIPEYAVKFIYEIFNRIK